MDQRTISIRILDTDYASVYQHLYRGDNEEHGAVFAVSMHRGHFGKITLIVHRVFIANDGSDFIPGEYGHRALSPIFIARVSNYCERKGLGYISVHNHLSDTSVGFSSVDLRSHERGYPALVDILAGQPVGALVFGKKSVAGRLWIDYRKFDFDDMTIVSKRHQRLDSGKKNSTFSNALGMYDRQSRLIGDSGQHILANSKIGIIGLGGAGSMISEWLAKLGVGSIVGIDFDWLELSNVPRVVGARRQDAVDLYDGQENPNAMRKVEIAERNARFYDPKIDFTAIPKSVVESEVANEIADCDFIFLCADKIQPRLVFNAIVNQYLIPGVQVGSKVPVDNETGTVANPFVVCRPVFPGPKGGCLLCNELIPADKLQEEALSVEEIRSQRYVDDVAVIAPSVITMNAVACADAINTFLYCYLGLASEKFDLRYHVQFCQERKWIPIAIRSNENCLHCSRSNGSGFGMGNSTALPCY